MDQIRSLLAPGDRVFYLRQLQVALERDFFHWVTSRALRFLIEDGEVLASQERNLRVVRATRFRYYRRAATRLANLVDKFSDPLVTQAIGHQLEALTLDAFSARQFVRMGRSTREYRGQVWERTAHDLDFIFERDGKAIGIECKNTLSYIDEKEMRTKMDLCDHLGIRPVFVVRVMPRTWIEEIRRRGGFTLMLSWWLFPPVLASLASEIRQELDYRVDTPRALQDGTMRRFERWWEALDAG